MKTILLADDHAMIRQGLRLILEGLPQKYNIIETNSCQGVLQAFSAQPVQYCILDMFLADGNLFSSIDQIRDWSRQVNILVYTMNTEKVYARRLMKKGVLGYVSKQARVEELEMAIDCLLKGIVYVNPALKEGMEGNPIDELSNRELEVIEYVAQGMGSKEIAIKMDLNITTVSTYRRRAFDKLEIQNIMELKEKLMWYKT